MGFNTLETLETVSRLDSNLSETLETSNIDTEHSAKVCYY